MRLKKSFELALNILIHSKLRSWLTIIGIVIGVAAIVAIVSIGEGAQANVQARLSGLGSDIITVTPGGGRASGGFHFEMAGAGSDFASSNNAKNLTIKDIQIIKTIEGVSFVNGIVSGKASMVYLAQTASVSVQGVDTFPWKNMVSTELESGRYLDSGDSNENVIVVGYRIAHSTFKQQLGINTVITLSANDNPAESYKIIGILKSSGGSDDNSAYMPVSSARGLLDKGNLRLDSISIKTQSSDIVDQVANATDLKLMLSRHVTAKTKDYSVTSPTAIQERLQSVTETFTIFLAAIAAVSLLVGAVGIANTMFTSVLEKTKEIGIMKAIGAKNFDIMMIFLLNSALVGLVGGALGILLGSVVSWILPNFLSGFGPLGGRGGLTTVIPAWLLIYSFLISVSIGMIAGAIPAYRASKLKPVDALRYE